MKAFASSVLYVLSIVVAGAIGMFQVGKEIRGESGNGSRECPYVFVDETFCYQVGLDPPCTHDHKRAVIKHPSYLGNYWNRERFQCGEYRLESVPNAPPREVFEAYPYCIPEPFTPSSEGCTG